MSGVEIPARAPTASTGSTMTRRTWGQALPNTSTLSILASVDARRATACLCAWVALRTSCRSPCHSSSLSPPLLDGRWSVYTMYCFGYAAPDGALSFRSPGERLHARKCLEERRMGDDSSRSDGVAATRAHARTAGLVNYAGRRQLQRRWSGSGPRGWREQRA